jgi:hypothetical protein
MPILLGIMTCPGGSQSDERNMLIYNESSESDYRDLRNFATTEISEDIIFRCTAALMDKFANVIDFTQYSEALWEGISKVVSELPAIVAKSNSTPSILHYFLSYHHCMLSTDSGNP